MIRLFRLIRRNPINFILGQFSLVLGILSCLIIFSFVSFHESFDSFYNNTDNIYRILRTEKSGRTIALTEGNLKEKLLANHSDVLITHFMKTPVDITLEFDKKAITEQNGLLVDQQFFSVFSCESVSGNVNDYLSQPNSIVLTKSIAEKLMGNSKSAIGEIVHIQMAEDKVPFIVTGIIEDNPSNSSLEFTYLMTGSNTIFWNEENSWTVFNTFIQINKAYEKQVVSTYLTSENKQDIQYKLQPLSEIRLSDEIDFDLFTKFEKKYLTILTSIGIFIFLITLFNFFNLFYTQVLSRIREITTRKVLGSPKEWVFIFLFREIGFRMLFSVLFSLTILYVLNKDFTYYFDFSPIKFYKSPIFGGVLIGALLIAAFFVLWITSQMFSYNTQLGLRGKMTAGKLGFNLGKLLLTTQLIVTLFSITFGLLISEQTSFLKNIDVGYSYENILTLKRPDNVSFHAWNSLKLNLDQQSSIQSTGLAVFPSIGEYNIMNLKNSVTQEDHKLFWMGVNPDYIPTLGIKLISGRNFDLKLKSDEQAIIINEKALHLIGGKTFLDHEFDFRKKPFKVIGVVRDFNHHSLKEEVQPMMMTLNNPIAFRHMTVRYSGLTQSEISELIYRECKELSIATNLNLTFMENDYNQKLLSEENLLSTVGKGSSIVAIIISLLGLINYFNFMVNQKKKDFSVRKVLGASLFDNHVTMMKPQIATFVLALIIAIPTALFFWIEWKSQFIYQLNLNLFHFLLPSGTILLIIALISLSFAKLIDRQNPVINLKDE